MYNIANGFHNAPAHYLRDHTVRVRDPITGFGTGLMVGGKEFTLGFYDAISGLVTQPYLGYQDPRNHNAGLKALGLTKGIGRGLGGLVLKSGAAVMGPPGYALKGLEREIERWWIGSDALLRGEVALIEQAKVQVIKAGIAGDAGQARLFWEEAKGAGVGKRIVERRIWEGYRQVKELRLKGE